MKTKCLQGSSDNTCPGFFRIGEPLSKGLPGKNRTDYGVSCSQSGALHTAAATSARGEFLGTGLLFQAMIMPGAEH